MPVWGWVVLAVVVIAVALAAWLGWQRQRSRGLRERFGPEYDRTLGERDDRRQAEAELAAREKRHAGFEIRPLDAEARERYANEWRDTQAAFVDRPVEAVRRADGLVSELMRERGYPVEDFDQRAADISVDHPDVVDNYRSAHAISLASDRNEANTEDLRKSMVHYRSLFDELLVEEERRPEEAR